MTGRIYDKTYDGMTELNAVNVCNAFNEHKSIQVNMDGSYLNVIWVDGGAVVDMTEAGHKTVTTVIGAECEILDGFICFTNNDCCLSVKVE